MSEVFSKENKRKKGKLAIAIVLAVVIIALISAIIFVSNCFFCPPEYPNSIMDWTVDYEPNKEAKGDIAQSGEKVISYFNNHLTDEEEEDIQDIFYSFSSNGQLNEFIFYLEGITPLSTDDRTGIDWLRYKFDEASRIYQFDGITDAWKYFLYEYFGLKSFKPSYISSKNDVKYREFVKDVILTNENLTLEGAKSFFGKDASYKKLQLRLIHYIPFDTAFYNRDVVLLYKDVFGRQSYMGEKYEDEFVKLKQKFGLGLQDSTRYFETIKRLENE